MDVNAYIEKKKAIQECLLSYLDDGTDDDYNNLIKLLNESQVSTNRNELKSILQLINAVILHHPRSANFFTKIDKILTNYISNIKEHFSKAEIYRQFNKNQRILLFLLTNDLISSDDLSKLPNYALGYFYPEIKSKVKKEKLEKITKAYTEVFEKFNEEEFNQKRLIAENDSYICELIRNDSIVEFIKYVNESNWPLEGQIKKSLFDTNLLFHDVFRNVYYTEDQPTLIEYAFFFGSIQIVKYLIANGVKLKYTLWPYAIHSNNAELIHILEEKGLVPPEAYYMTRDNKFISERVMKENEKDDQKIVKTSVWKYETFKTSLVQAIRCHNNDIYNYILSVAPEMQPDTDSVNDFYRNTFTSDSSTNVTFAIFKNYNYLCFPENIEKEMLFFYACKYGYASIVEILLKEKRININKTIVLY